MLSKIYFLLILITFNIYSEQVMDIIGWKKIPGNKEAYKSSHQKFNKKGVLIYKYEYDAIDYIKKEETYRNDGKILKEDDEYLYIHNKYEYDKKNRLIFIDGYGGEVSWSRSYQYKKNYYIETMKTLDHDGKDQRHVTYYYLDHKGREIDIKSYETNSKRLEARVLKHYDKKGNLITETTYKYEEGMVVETIKVEYKYTPDHKLLSAISHENNLLSEEVLNVYDDKGRLLSETNNTYEEGKIKDVNKIIYEHTNNQFEFIKTFKNNKLVSQRIEATVSGKGKKPLFSTIKEYEGDINTKTIRSVHTYEIRKNKEKSDNKKNDVLEIDTAYITEEIYKEKPVEKKVISFYKNGKLIRIKNYENKKINSVIDYQYKYWE